MEQKILMLTENYNIYKILDNTILGFFAGIISGLGIEAFMNGNSNLHTTIVFIIFCLLSVWLMLRAMDTNSVFIQKCKDVALNQEEYQNREKIIDKLTENTKKIQKKFKWLFWGAVISLLVGIVILKVPLLPKLFNTSHVTCPHQQTDSIQSTENDSVNENKTNTIMVPNDKVIENYNAKNDIISEPQITKSKSPQQKNSEK